MEANGLAGLPERDVPVEHLRPQFHRRESSRHRRKQPHAHEHHPCLAIEVDNTAPTITLGTVSDDRATNGTLTFSYVTDPDVVRVDFTYFNGTWNTIGSDISVDGTFGWTPSGPIENVTVRAVAIDDVGLRGTTDKVGVGRIVPSVNPPTNPPPGIWQTPYVLAIPPIGVLVMIGMFAQRQRWRPAKAFLVDERGKMLREFTLDPACQVTYGQVVEAGILDAVDKPIKIQDRKSTRLNSSHRCISYAVF